MKKFFSRLWKIITFPFRAIWWLLSLPVRAVRKVSRFLNEVPEEHELGDALATTIQNPGGFLEQLNDLRKHLFRMLICVAICVAVTFIFTPQMIDFLAQPIGGLEELTAIDVTEPVGVYMRVALLGAIVLASPYIAFEIWLFAAPGLMPRSKKFGLLGIPLVLLFFVGGITFTYLFILPAALPFLLNFMGIQTLPRVSNYINFVTGMMFWLGLAFEFPLVVYILTMMGILKPQMLAKHWRVAVVIIAIFAAVITPTADPINMSIVMAPLLVLYVISIGLSFLASLGWNRKKTTN